jgi:IS5 family transposase
VIVEKNHTIHHWGKRRGGMAMVQDTQSKRWKRPQVSRIPARLARVLWQEALLTGVCWRDVSTQK